VIGPFITMLHLNSSAINDHVSWNSAAYAFMLKHLAEIVATGTRTSSGFKKVHRNMCARAINDHFKTKYIGENVKNHLWTCQRRYAKILRLRKLSASDWDEDNCMITLDAEHYAGYVAVLSMMLIIHHLNFII
jgi:hypothetical protein